MYMADTDDTMRSTDKRFFSETVSFYNDLKKFNNFNLNKLAIKLGSSYNKRVVFLKLTRSSTEHLFDRMNVST